MSQLQPDSSLWGPSTSGGTPGRVAGAVVTSSAALLPSTTVDAGYKNLEITLHGTESFGTHFFQLYFNGDTTLANYYLNHVSKYSTGTFSSLNQQAPYLGGFYVADTDAYTFITIPDYATTGTKTAFFTHSVQNPSGAVYLTGAVYYKQTAPITSVQISLRSNFNTIGTAQNVTATYSLAYLV